MTKTEVERLRAELNKVLTAFNKTSDIKMSLKNATYGTDVTFKLVGNITKNGIKQTTESANFIHYQSIHRIPIEALNYSFTHNRDTISITGYSTRSSKYPIQYLLNGSSYKCSTKHMLDILRHSAPEILL